MRAGVTIIALLALSAGCASHRPESSRLERQEAELRYADASPAGALSFDPPIAQGNPRLNLSRTPRQPSAFVGFDQTVTTFFYVRSDDRQTENHNNDRFERRAISEQFGTSYR